MRIVERSFQDMQMKRGITNARLLALAVRLGSIFAGLDNDIGGGLRGTTEVVGEDLLDSGGVASLSVN